MFSDNHHQTTCEVIVKPRAASSSRVLVVGFSLIILLGLALTLFGCIALAHSDNQNLIDSVGESTSKDQDRDVNDWRSLPFPGSFPSLLRQDLERTWAEIDALTADDKPNYAIAVSERFLWLVEAARDYSPSPDQEHWMAVRSQYSKRMLKAHDFGNRFVHWHRLYKEAETWTRAIAAAESIVGLLKENIASDEWNNDERFEFETLLEQWHGKLAEASEEYRFRKQDINERFMEAQARFIAEQVVRDLQEAQELLQSQDRKRFNWRLFGRPRDNQELVLMAAQRSRRVLEESHVSPLAYAEAERLLEQAKRRLGRRMRQRLRNGRPLPPYQNHTGYPSVTEEEMRLLADWRDFDFDGEDAHSQHPNSSPAQATAGPADVSQNSSLSQTSIHDDLE